jgi:hypothetical protein
MVAVKVVRHLVSGFFYLVSHSSFWGIRPILWTLHDYQAGLLLVIHTLISSTMNICGGEEQWMLSFTVYKNVALSTCGRAAIPSGWARDRL